MLDVELDNRFVEEVNVYVEYTDSTVSIDREKQGQRCVAIERPQLTLDKVIDGMAKNGGYNKQNLRVKFSAKICTVLRSIGKALP